MNSRLIGYLFETRAIRVCPKDMPFWYTSGKIGPYYINTHFLYGSEGLANEFLSEIDAIKDDKIGCSDLFFQATKAQYCANSVFMGTMDCMIQTIREQINPDEIDYISGGERRDWFFSFLVADALKKPHITLFKDLDAVVYENGASRSVSDLNGARVLHVADLITTASSYERAWVPIIKRFNGQMKWSMVVIDRLQGGKEVLHNLSVASHALVRIDEDVFQKACENHYIDEAQLRMVLKYMHDPEASMRLFLKQNPGFLSDALKNGGKTADRAKMLIENNFYGLKED